MPGCWRTGASRCATTASASSPDHCCRAPACSWLRAGSPANSENRLLMRRPVGAGSSRPATRGSRRRPCRPAGRRRAVLGFLRAAAQVAGEPVESREHSIDRRRARTRAWVRHGCVQCEVCEGRPWTIPAAALHSATARYGLSGLPRRRFAAGASTPPAACRTAAPPWRAGCLAGEQASPGLKPEKDGEDREGDPERDRKRDGPRQSPGRAQRVRCPAPVVHRVRFHPGWRRGRRGAPLIRRHTLTRRMGPSGGMALLDANAACPTRFKFNLRRFMAAALDAGGCCARVV